MEKKIHLKIGVLLSVLAFFASCSTTQLKYTQIDLLRPAKVTFDAKIKRVLVVNDIPKLDYAKFEGDSVPYFCVASVTENLQMKSFFESVQLAKESTNGKLKKNFNLVKSLCKKYDVDAVIALNTITSGYDKERNDWEGYSALLIRLHTFWNVYTLDKRVPKELGFTDDFSWEMSLEDFDKLPKMEDAYIDATILTGSNVVERLIPSWEKQDRYFFTSKNKQMIKAMDEVAKKNWNKAISIWNEIVANKSSKPKQKFHAYNNLAISYEILGNINRAISYTDKAIELYSDAGVRGKKELKVFEDLLLYKDFLTDRKKEITLLKKQLANE